MTRFMLVLAAAAVCGPLAANAAVLPAPTFSTVAAAAVNSGDTAYQVAHLNGQVMTLNSEVQSLELQNAAGTAYTAELSGVIPTGG